MKHPTFDEVLLTLTGETAEFSIEELRELALASPTLRRDVEKAENLLEAEHRLREARFTTPAGLSERILAALPAEMTLSSPPQPLWERILDCFDPRLVAGAAALSIVVMITALAHRQLHPAPASVARADNTEIEVLVPTTDIAPGMRLSASMFAKVRRVRGSVPAEAIYDETEVVGKFARHLLVADYPFDSRFLSVSKPREYLADGLREGHRVLSVSITNGDPDSLPVQPGHEVSVIWGERKKTGPFIPKLRLTAEATVLAVNAAPSASGAYAHIVTIEVPEHEAAAIDLGKAAGEVFLLANSPTSFGTDVTASVHSAGIGDSFA